MEKTLYFNELYTIYGGLLTENEREIFKIYYEENLSMQEIASIKNITKSAVGNSIKTTKNKLISYEEKLGFKRKKELVIDVVKDTSLEEKIREILES